MPRAVAKQGKLPQSFFLELAPSGDFLIAAGHRIARWDRAARSVRYRRHPLSHPDSCSIRAQEDLVALKSTSGQIQLIAADDGADVRDLGNRERGEGSNVMFSNCGDFLVDGSWDGALIVRSAQTGRIEFERRFPGDMLCHVDRHRDSNRWAVLHSPRVRDGESRPAAGHVTTWSWPFSEPDGIITLETSVPRHIRFSPDGSRAAISAGNSVMIVRLADGACLAKTELAPETYRGELDWSPDGNEIAVVGKDCIVSMSVADLTVIKAWPLEYASDVRYFPDGDTLALGSWGSGLWVTR